MPHVKVVSWHLEEAEIENEFMQKGVDMLVDGHDIDVVRADFV